MRPARHGAGVGQRAGVLPAGGDRDVTVFVGIVAHRGSAPAVHVAVAGQRAAVAAAGGDGDVLTLVRLFAVHLAGVVAAPAAYARGVVDRAGVRAARGELADRERARRSARPAAAGERPAAAVVERALVEVDARAVFHDQAEVALAEHAIARARTGRSWRAGLADEGDLVVAPGDRSVGAERVSVRPTGTRRQRLPAAALRLARRGVAALVAVARRLELPLAGVADQRLLAGMTGAGAALVLVARCAELAHSGVELGQGRDVVLCRRARVCARVRRQYVGSRIGARLQIEVTARQHQQRQARRARSHRPIVRSAPSSRWGRRWPGCRPGRWRWSIARTASWHR